MGMAHDPSSFAATILEAVPEPVVVLDSSGNVRWGNRAAERMFGRSLNESVGMPALDLVHPDDLELVLRSFSSVQRKVVGTLIEVRVMTVTGWRVIEVIGAPTVWQDDGMAVVFCFRDLTDRRRFEVARKDEASFRTLLQNSPTVTILLTDEGRIESASASISRVLGHDPENIEGQRLVNLVANPDRVAFLAALGRAIKGATASSPVTVRVHLPRYPTDELILAELTLVNLLDDLTVRGILVTAQDITARAKAEHELHAELVAHAKTASRLLQSLTRREIEVLDMLAETETASEIAKKLVVSVRTVESHLANAYRKLGVHNRAAATIEFARLRQTVTAKPAELDAGGHLATGSVA